MTLHRIFTTLLLGVFILSACAPAAGTQPAGDPTSLLDQEWVLKFVGREMPVVAGSTLTLTLGSDGTASGKAGCNSFGGSYTIKGDQITFGELVTTLMACADEAVMTQETQYLDALQSAGIYSVTSDELTIEYNGGEGVLVYIKASAMPAPTETAVPMSMSASSSLYSSSMAGLTAYNLLTSPLATVVPADQGPITTAKPTSSGPISTAEPTINPNPITTAEPSNPIWYADQTYLDDRSTPSGLIASYISAINRREYLRAYSYWRTPQTTLGKYEIFATGFAQTASVKVRLGQILQSNTAGQIYYSVPVLIKAVTTTGEQQRFIACYVLQISKPATQSFPPFIPLGIARGVARVVTTPGGARALLETACIGADDVGVPIPAPGTDHQDTQARNYLDERSDPTQVLRSLVNAINRKEYARAYDYWEHFPGTSNVPPFDKFVKGYADTKQVQLKVGIIKGDAGAGQFYYSVPVLLTVKTTSGATQTFVGCYVLHISNPSIQGVPPFQPLAIRSADVHEVPDGADPNALLAKACNP